MKPTQPKIVNNIIYQLKKGFTCRQIAKGICVCPSTVSNIAKKYNLNISNNKGGSKSKMSEVDKRKVIRNIMSGKCDTAIQAAKMLQKDVNITVNPQTIRNLLHSKGFQAKHKIKKPAISLKNQRKRLEFAKIHKDWSIDDWSCVIWSDETKINRMGSDGRPWCWKSQKERLTDRIIKPVVKYGGGSLMIWGCMTAHGVGYMTRIEGRMDADMYCQILEDELTKTIEYYKMERNSILFQHDNDPKHTAKKTKFCLEKMNMKVLLWPAQSPDLNPIEHLWSSLKWKIGSYPAPPEGLYELWERIEENWNNISKQECTALIESMPRRIDAVLKAKGRHTRY